MLRDCDASRAWELSFIAVNMHPHHRISFEDWIQKISGFVEAADKFEEEEIDVRELLPKVWLEQPLAKRQEWTRVVQQHNESWDVAMLTRLRDLEMPLTCLAQIFKIYHAEKKLRDAPAARTPRPDTPRPSTPTPVKKKQILCTHHLFKAGSVSRFCCLSVCCKMISTHMRCYRCRERA